MRRITSRRARLRVTGAVAAVVTLMALAGCSGGIAQELLDPMEQARSAVRTDQLVFEQLAQGRVTTGLAETVLTTMTDELTSAEESINSAEVSSQGDEPLRDAAIAAAREATSASAPRSQNCKPRQRRCKRCSINCKAADEAHLCGGARHSHRHRRVSRYR
jgi:hypothetical protein